MQTAYTLCAQTNAHTEDDAPVSTAVQGQPFVANPDEGGCECDLHECTHVCICLCV